ncbi:unnamed protein product, partial [Ixodes pacificus]
PPPPVCAAHAAPPPSRTPSSRPGGSVGRLPDSRVVAPNRWRRPKDCCRRARTGRERHVSVVPRPARATNKRNRHKRAWCTCSATARAYSTSTERLQACQRCVRACTVRAQSSLVVSVCRCSGTRASGQNSRSHRLSARLSRTPVQRSRYDSCPTWTFSRDAENSALRLCRLWLPEGRERRGASFERRASSKRFVPSAAIWPRACAGGARDADASS